MVYILWATITFLPVFMMSTMNLWNGKLSNWFAKRTDNKNKTFLFSVILLGTFYNIKFTTPGCAFLGFGFLETFFTGTNLSCFLLVPCVQTYWVSKFFSIIFCLLVWLCFSRILLLFFIWSEILDFGVSVQIC